MTRMEPLPFIYLLEDLSRDLSVRQRYQRMVAAIRATSFNLGVSLDAVALLKLEGDSLRPVAALGLKMEVLARRFKVAAHPRLKIILENRRPTRFSADSTLADPYDGLIDGGGTQLEVHDCMGCAIYIDEQPWGVLTLDAMQAGAFDLFREVDGERHMQTIKALIQAIQRIETLENQAVQQHEIARRLLVNELSPEIIGRSPVIQTMLAEIDTVAGSELSVLITGETGVGKELVAHSLHQYSARRDQALVQLNCAALAENIIESELFGHLRGAYSGASSDRRGRFELADGGTLFLDEIGELPLSAQAKLLRALQSGEIQRVGSDQDISVDVRIIAATNRDLQQEVKAGRFRADLYHRLSVYPLLVPPLREREQDCELLAGFFLEKYQQQLGVKKLCLSHAARAQLLAYDWPGNVRELEHLLSRAALKAVREQGQGRVSPIISLETRHLGLTIEPEQAGQQPPAEPPLTVSGDGFRERVDHFQQQLIEQALQNNAGNLAATARELKLDRSNLLRTIKRLAG